MKHILLTLFFAISISISSQTSYVWNGSTSTAWNTNTNWTPNGIPGAADNVTIVTGSNNCILHANLGVTNIVVTSGTLNLNGFTITPTGNATFTSGTVSNGTLTVSGSTSNTATLSNTTFAVSSTLNITTGAITVNGGTYHGPVALNQTGATQTSGSGGATFNNSLSITNSGTNHFRMNGNNTYNGTTTFTINNGGYILPELTTGSTYNGNLILNNNSASQNIRMAYLGTNNFNGNITINNTAGSGVGIVFCEQASATATLANTKTISVGGLGFSLGTLTLNRFTQVGTSPQTLNLSGSATCNILFSSTFNGDLNITSPNIYVANSTFNGVTTLTKTNGTSSNTNNGGNTFNNTLNLNYTSTVGNGYISMGYGAPDVYNGDVYSNNNSLDRIIFAHNSLGNQFNGNIIITQIGSSVGTSLAWNLGSTSIIAATKTIQIGGAGFNTGWLYLQGITQNGSAPVSITTTGSSSIVVGNAVSNTLSTFGGPLSITAPDIYLRGGTYNNPVTIVKTGGSSNHNNGNQNIFNSTLDITNQSSGGYFMVGYNSNELFNDNITVSSTGTGGISLGWSGGTGTPTLAAGKTISIGGAGFSAGYLQFGSFTQNGSAPINLTLTGTAQFYIQNSSIPCSFGGPLTVTAPDLYIRGGTFNGATSFIKTGGTSNHNNGNQNIFNSTLDIQNQSIGYFMLGYNSNEQFNGDITVSSSGTGGISLGWSAGTGTPTLASGKTINIGGSGFSSGYLQLGGFTQLGSAPINLPMTGSAAFYITQNSLIGGNLIVSAADIYFNGATFNGTVDATKTGNSGQWGNGGNIFNGVTTLTNTGSGYFGLANGTADIFNQDLYTNNSGSERIIFGNGAINMQFNGNIILTQTGSAVGTAFSWGSTTTCTLAPGKTILVGGAGFSVGYLQLPRFTQLGSAAINLPLIGTTSASMGPNSAFGGDFTLTAGDIYFNGATYSRSVTATKTSSNGNWSVGGNTFNGICTFNNTSAGYFALAYSSADIYNDDVYTNNSGTERIIFGNGAFNLQFNGNIIITQTGSAVGTFIDWGASTTSTLAATKSISIGAAGFSCGYFQFPRFTQLGSAAINLPMTGTSNLIFGPSSSLGGNVTSTSSTLYFNGCTFAGTVNSTKYGSTNDNSSGTNTFNGDATLTCSGSGYLLFGNGNADIFNAASTFNNTGTANIYVAYNSSNNIFGGVATFNNTPSGTGLIHVSPYSTGTLFNDNIIVTSTAGQGVQFCQGNTTATATLANTKTITIGAGGFTSGTLLLKQFNQVGSTSQSLVQTSGTGILTLGPSSNFDGNVTFNFPQVYLHGTTYNGTASIEKNGASDNPGNGGNIFNATTTITNSGSGYLLTGNINRDQFNGSTTFNNTGSYRFFFAHNHTGQTTTFAQDLTLNSNKSGGSDGWSFFAGEGNNTSYTINGNFILNDLGSIQSNCRFLQGSSTTAIYNGNTTINFSNTNTSSYIQIGLAGISTYNGNIIVSSTGGANGIYFNVNNTASSTLSATKTISLGPGGFTSGNLSLVRFSQIGSTPQSMLQTTGTAAIYLGPTSSFDGDVTFNFPQVYLNGTTYNGVTVLTKNGATDNAGTGGNIFNNTATINNSGSGYLLTGNTTRDQFNGLTTFNNTGTYRIYFAHNHGGQTTTFANDVVINSAKSGGSDTWSYLISEGNNSLVSFGGNVTMNVSGSIRSDFRVLQGTSTTATYGGDLTINLSNTHASTQLTLGTVGTSSYNGNIIITNTGGGASGGVYFNTTSSASSTLANSKAISLGAGGFTGGTLSLIRFTQLGVTAQLMNQTSGTATLILGPTSTFNGSVNFNFPQIYLNGTTYNASATLQKNGATDNDCLGNNIFNSTTNITNTSSNRLRLANNLSDAYNGDVTFTQNNTGVLAPNYNTNCTYGGNITVSSASTYTITFGTGGSGIATLNGANAQTINKTGSVGIPVFTRLVVNKSANDVTLNTRINISSSLTMTQGIINTTQSNILNMNDASITTVGNANSYINGPMNYDMAVNNTTRTLNMPIGKGSDWRPVALTVRHSAGTSFTYNSEVFNASAVALGWTKPATVDTVSSVHYWDINRYTTGTNTSVPSTNLSYSAGAYPLIQLYFGTNDYVYDGTNLTIVKNTSAAPTTWIDIGGSSGIGVNASPVAGSVTSTSNPSAFNSFSRFTLGSKLSGLNPLPIEYLSFDAKPNGKHVDLNWSTAREENSHYFAIEHSLNGSDFKTIGTQEAAHSSYSIKDYYFEHQEPTIGMNYYRIKEFDYNNSTTVSTIKSVVFSKEASISYYPNPTKDLLFLNSSDENEVSIEIISTTGVSIGKFSFRSEASINLKNLSLASGMYTLKITHNGTTTFSKLIVEN